VLIGDGRLMTLFLLGISLSKYERRSTEWYSSGGQDWLSEKLEVICVKIYITDFLGFLGDYNVGSQEEPSYA
jgi:hypothetical protein